MRNIQGFICIAATTYHKDQFILFGKNMSQRKQLYQNFETNDFTPFNTVSEAKSASEQILQINHIKKVDIAGIKMQIAENEKEIYEFKNKKNLVVVKITECQDKELYGKLVEDHATYLAASLFVLNGLISFDSFNIAIQSIREINRQAQSPATIGSLEIKKIQGGNHERQNR